MSPSFYFKQINYYAQHYGNGGIPDQRAVGVFMECETSEAVRMLQNELRAVANGNYDPHSMDINVGIKRKALHKSYDEWAKLMLLWIAGYKV